jgi:hypothetical protein
VKAKPVVVVELKSYREAFNCILIGSLMQTTLECADGRFTDSSSLR